MTSGDPRPAYVLDAGGRYALLVAVGAHGAASGLPLRPNARADADALASVLREGPTPYHVRRLSDGADAEARPTRAQIQIEVERLAAVAGPEDLLLVYFSGHAVAAADEVFLMPADGRREHPAESGISLRGLRAALAQAPGAARLVVIDASDGAASPTDETLVGGDLASRVGTPVAGTSVLAAIDGAGAGHGGFTAASRRP